MKKALIVSLLLLTISTAQADYSLSESIDNTLASKTALTLAGLSITLLTRAKTIADYSYENTLGQNCLNLAEYSHKQFVKSGWNTSVDKVLNFFGKNKQNALQDAIALKASKYIATPKTAEKNACTIAGTACLLAFMYSFISNG